MVLKGGDTELIQKLFQDYSNEVRGILKSLVQLSYYMRGAIQYDEMFNRTFAERQIFEEFVKDRLETEGKKMNPVY